MNLDTKIALVTGARRGIGKAIAEMLAERGAKVIGTATNEEGAKAISNHLGYKGTGVTLNLTDSKSIDSTIYKIREELGEIDILINNAGIISDNLLVRMKEVEWNKVININLNAIFIMSKAIIRSMIKKRYGRIISISSVVGAIGNIGQTNYAAAKAGVIAFSKSLAREVASSGITVNVVSPGFINTDMTQTLTDEQRTGILANIPVRRLGDAKEVACAVAFLASNEASYITGETLHVNGGMYMA